MTIITLTGGDDDVKINVDVDVGDVMMMMMTMMTMMMMVMMMMDPADDHGDLVPPDFFLCIIEVTTAEKHDDDKE